jgi:hypothetical protein
MASFAVLALAALPGCGGEEDVGVQTAAVSCDPSMPRHPVHGPHNTGYDGAWSDFRCDGSLANSDYGGDHHGIDIFAARGTPVVSPVDGVVIRAGVASSSSGNRVTVQDGCGWAYYMGHLDTITVPEGARVRAGDAIGTVGNTGTPTAPHVHFNVNRDGDYYDDIDPIGLLAAVEDSSCGAAPECVGRPATFCVDATRIASCATGRFDVGDCAAYGTTCDADTGTARCTPHLDAVFVGSSFPGGVRIEVEVGREVSGCLTYRNTGSWTWDGQTRLGTTLPRDRASEHAASGWLGPNRLASAEGSTAHGADGRFCFALRGAASPGEREERFSLVQEGRFWAADVGGVADTVNVVTVVTVPASAPTPAPGVEVDAGVPAPDAAYSGADAGLGDGGMMRAPTRGDVPPARATLSGSCSASPGSRGAPLALTLALSTIVAARGRRRARETRRHGAAPEPPLRA